MSKVKGRYVATVIIDIEYDEEVRPDILPFRNAEQIFREDKITETLKRLIDSEMGITDIGTLDVVKQYADLYKVDEDLLRGEEENDGRE